MRKSVHTLSLFLNADHCNVKQDLKEDADHTGVNSFHKCSLHLSILNFLTIRESVDEYLIKNIHNFECRLMSVHFPLDKGVFI
jgi:hypothetical protein